MAVTQLDVLTSGAHLTDALVTPSAGGTAIKLGELANAGKPWRHTAALPATIINNDTTDTQIMLLTIPGGTLTTNYDAVHIRWRGSALVSGSASTCKLTLAVGPTGSARTTEFTQTTTNTIWGTSAYERDVRIDMILTRMSATEMQIGGTISSTPDIATAAGDINAGAAIANRLFGSKRPPYTGGLNWASGVDVELLLQFASNAGTLYGRLLTAWKE